MNQKYHGAVWGSSRAKNMELWIFLDKVRVSFNVQLGDDYELSHLMREEHEITVQITFNPHKLLLVISSDRVVEPHSIFLVRIAGRRRPSVAPVRFFISLLRAPQKKKLEIGDPNEAMYISASWNFMHVEEGLFPYDVVLVLACDLILQRLAQKLLQLFHQRLHVITNAWSVHWNFLV